MSQVLNFFTIYEYVIYFLLGIGGALYLYRFILAWQEYREAVFGLERETAQGKLNQAAVVLFLLLVIGVSVFSLVTFVAPLAPVSAMLFTPTADLSGGAPATQAGGTPSPGPTAQLASATPLPTVEITSEGCRAGVLEITSPEADETISGEVQVLGTVNIENFGFYKFEVARAEDGLWQTIQAGRTIVNDDVLVDNWDTTRFPPGNYVLQLVVTDNAGDELPPCRIPVRIAPPAPEAI